MNISLTSFNQKIIDTIIGMDIREIESYVASQTKRSEESRYLFAKRDYCAINNKRVRFIVESNVRGGKRSIIWDQTRSKCSVEDAISATMKAFKLSHSKQIHFEIYSRGSLKPYHKSISKKN